MGALKCDCEHACRILNVTTLNFILQPSSSGVRVRVRVRVRVSRAPTPTGVIGIRSKLKRVSPHRVVKTL
jgi:hypothetical protein